MPTLIEEETFGDTGDTACTADMAWIAKEFGQDGNDDDADGTNNDTTLSGSMLLTALDVFRKSQKTESPMSEPSFSTPKTHNKSCLNQSISLLGSPDFTVMPPQTPQHHLDTKNAPPSSPPPPPSTQHKSSIAAVAPHLRIEFTPGPNQEAYENGGYKDFVSKAVNESRKRYPGKIIPSYKDLSPEKQRVEQERVLHLLERLQLGCTGGGGGGGGGNRVAENNNSAIGDSSSMRTPAAKQSGCLDRFTSNGKKKSISFAATSQCDVLDDSAGLPPQDDTMDTSIALLSPIPQQESTTPKQSTLDVTSGPPASPVEVSRAAARFSSPPMVGVDADDDDGISSSDSYRKRMATTSGKRGADLSRRKRVEDSEVLPTMDFQSPQPKIFSASQSPILSETEEEDERNLRSRKPPADFSEDSSIEGSPGSNISLGDHLHQDPDETLDAIYETTLGRPALASLANNVHLKKGASVHFEPLHTKRQRPKTKAMTQTFPDPFEYYTGKTYDKMKFVYKWIRKRMESKSVPGGVVFSMSEQKIMDTCLRLIVRVSAQQIEAASSQSKASDTIQGQTLIVVRERDSLEDWKRIFREGSNLGVICHCELPLKERKSLSTAHKCSKYGIVLTTFDALISPDCTIVLEEGDGVAMVEQSQDPHGWMQGRGSSSQSESQARCKRLSILHRLKWKQIIFVDALGRRSYMAKPDTSRNKAAALLAADARLLFFAQYDDSPSGFSELLKSDRRAVSGVSAVLHAEWEQIGDGDSSGKGITLDFEDAARIRTTSQKRAARLI